METFFLLKYMKKLKKLELFIIFKVFFSNSLRKYFLFIWSLISFKEIHGAN